MATISNPSLSSVQAALTSQRTLTPTTTSVRSSGRTTFSVTTTHLSVYSANNLLKVEVDENPDSTLNPNPVTTGGFQSVTVIGNDGMLPSQTPYFALADVNITRTLNGQVLSTTDQLNIETQINSGIAGYNSNGNTPITLTAYDSSHALLVLYANNDPTQGVAAAYEVTTDFAGPPNSFYGTVGVVPSSSGQTLQGTGTNTGATFFTAQPGEFIQTLGEGGGTTFSTPTIACFTAGTLIATPAGEVAVEHLAISDLVATASGAAKPVKWLGRRMFTAADVAANQDVQPVRIIAGALGRGLPVRDLMLSPEHALLIDGALVPAAALVNGASVVRITEGSDVSYVHIELDDHDAIFAEGAAAETFVDDNSRAMFANAAEYAALYGNEAPRDAAFCAPRLVEGEALEALRAKLAVIAGQQDNATAEPVGEMAGHVEAIARTGDAVRVNGWVIDTLHPSVPVRLEVFSGSRVVATTLANRYRADLRAAGFGDGRCAFSVTLPADCGVVTVRRAADGVTLPVARMTAAA